jgi:hypothetical protein
MHGKCMSCFWVAWQADFLKLLYDKMMELHVQHVDGPEEWRFPLPSFKASVPVHCVHCECVAQA